MVFYGDPQGNLGTSHGATGVPFTSWLGSTSTAYVVIWYDQSGTGHNATQLTARYQPKYNAVLKLVDFQMPGTFMQLPSAFFPSGSKNYTFVAQHGAMNTSSATYLFGVGSTCKTAGTGVNLKVSLSNSYYDSSWCGGSDNIFSPISNQLRSVVSEVYNGHTRSAYVDSMLQKTMTVSSARAGAASLAYLGKSVGSGNSTFQGQVYSLFVSKTALATSDRNVLEGVFVTCNNGSQFYRYECWCSPSYYSPTGVPSPYCHPCSVGSSSPIIGGSSCPCSINFYSSTGSSPCHKCGVNSSTYADTCNSLGVCTYALAASQTTCRCNAGYYSPTGSSPNCSVIPSGAVTTNGPFQRMNWVGGATPLSCKPTFYNPINGYYNGPSSPCMPCGDPSVTSTGYASLACTVCSINYFSSAGTAPCAKCATSVTNTATGSVSCPVCALGYYSPTGRSP
jgi:hypothetical protein